MSEVIILNRSIKYTVDSNKCWIPTNRAINKQDGYVRISFIGKHIYLHRASFKQFHRPIKQGEVIRHKCDNPSCFNPDHLEVGTKSDNTQDMIKRGRQSDWKDRKGSQAKLTLRQFNLIKESSLSSYRLAQLFPVSSTQIRRIKNGTRGHKGMR